MNCKIIQDLLPLYVDSVCSKESCELVQEHLKTCPACARELDMMRQGTPEVPEVESDHAKAIINTWRRHKRKTILKVFAFILAGILSFTAVFIMPNTKWGITTTAKLWEDEITAYAIELLEQGETERKEFLQYSIEPYPDAGLVVFANTGINGFGYTGFYYSATGEPMGFQGETLEFYVIEGYGWMWHEERGDNWQYSEHIVGNLYWFEAHF